MVERATFHWKDGEGPPKRTLDGLERITDPRAGEWLVASMTTFAKRVGSLLPDHFEKYARVFHPLTRERPRQAEPLSWREAAAAAGVELNARTRCEDILAHGRHKFSARVGNLSPALMGPLIEHLSKATSTPADCYFALWEGYAGTVPYETAEPTLLLPARKYHVVRGRIEAVHVSFQEYFGEQSANLWWPADHAWCVATEIDLYSTLVGGPRDCIDALLADPRIESVETFADCDRW